ncbi:MAG: hypothetical protein ACSLEZ_05830 [Thiobacillus sp.]
MPLFTAIHKTSRSAIALFLFISFALLVGQARAETVNPNPVGPWVVTEAKDSSNIGLVFYFSPDGTFGLIDPKTRIGAAGTYSIGRAGLMINVFNIGKSAEFITGDFNVSGDNMTIDVKQSAVMAPQRVVLQVVKVIPPRPVTATPATK